MNVGEEDAAAANAFVGYNFNEYFGSELGYQYTGRGNTDGNRYESQGATLSGIARLPLGNDFSLFGEAGRPTGATPTVWAPAIPKYPRWLVPVPPTRSTTRWICKLATAYMWDVADPARRQRTLQVQPERCDPWKPFTTVRTSYLAFPGPGC